MQLSSNDILHIMDTVSKLGILHGEKVKKFCAGRGENAVCGARGDSSWTMRLRIGRAGGGGGDAENLGTRSTGHGARRRVKASDAVDRRVVWRGVKKVEQFGIRNSDLGSGVIPRGKRISWEPFPKT